VPKKPFDTGEEPPGGRAAERLREFEQARGIAADETDQLDDESSANDLDSDDSDDLTLRGDADMTPPSQATERVNDNTEDD
jgi:hypothetical protein